MMRTYWAHWKWTTISAVLLGVMLLLVLLSGCGLPEDTKRVEQYKDAPVGQRQTTAADIVSMPDGFSNFAAVCEGPNRVYTIFHYSNDKETGGDTYGAIAAVPDPRCAAQMEAKP